MIIEGDYDKENWFGDVRVDGQRLDPAASQKVWNHSPDGFAWSYGGSGPAQLALAILLAAGAKNQLAVALHQRFKAEFLVNLPRDAFQLDVDVMAWIQKNKLTTAVPTEDADGE